MKIALVYPPISETGFNAEGKDAVFSQIHAGLSYLSAACKREGFNDITLIDLRALGGWKEFEDSVRDLRPSVLGITLMSSDYNDAMKCFEIVKKIDPSIKTIAGGMHPTVATDEIAGNDNIDHTIVGEGEISLPKLLKDIQDGKKNERVIKG